jgi:hypothetical protein
MSFRKTATSLTSLEEAILHAAEQLDESPSPDKGKHARVVDIYVSTGTLAGTQWRATVEPSSAP